MADEAPDTGTDATTVTPTEPPASEQQPAVTGDPLFAEIAKVAEELGIVPGQLLGRLEASRKWEERAKANAEAAEKLTRIEQESMSDIDKARAQARAEVLREVGASRVEDTVRAAAAGRNVDVDALLEGLDRTRFLDHEGQPDRAAVLAWVDRIAPQKDATTVAPDLGQGVRPGAPVALNGSQLERDLRSKLGIS